MLFFHSQILKARNSSRLGLLMLAAGLIGALSIDCLRAEERCAPAPEVCAQSGTIGPLTVKEYADASEKITVAGEEGWAKLWMFLPLGVAGKAEQAACARVDGLKGAFIEQVRADLEAQHGTNCHVTADATNTPETIAATYDPHYADDPRFGTPGPWKAGYCTGSKTGRPLPQGGWQPAELIECMKYLVGEIRKRVRIDEVTVIAQASCTATGTLTWRCSCESTTSTAPVCRTPSRYVPLEVE